MRKTQGVQDVVVQNQNATTMKISPTEAFAAMNEAVHGKGGKILQRKFKVSNSGLHF
jgi:hypothetical protein